MTITISRETIGLWVVIAFAWLAALTEHWAIGLFTLTVWALVIRYDLAAVAHFDKD
jgi:hypothetical protein